MLALDHAPVRKLLTRFAVKAQKAGGGSCTQKIDEKSFPFVYSARTGEEADYHWELLKDAAAQCSVSIVLKATKQHVAEYESERSPKLQVLDSDLPKLLTALGVAPLAPSHKSEWRAALVAGLDAPSSVVEAMTAYTLKIEGKTMPELVQALNHIRRLKGRQLLLREVSSLAFWSMSKELDDRAEMVAKLLEVEECPFALPPIHLPVRLPPGALHGVLFVENKTTFDTLRSTEAAGLAIIYGAGFMASARRLTTRSEVSVHFADGTGLDTTAAQLLHAYLFDGALVPSFFFGDLDFSGMDILKTMRRNFPNLQAWPEGYTRLLTRLTAGEGHAPAAAHKEGQRDPGVTGCPFADYVLLPAMRSSGLFVDQE